MQNYTIEIFQHIGWWAIFVSIIFNIIISILAIVPSVFLTAANIIVFGLPLGITISIAGEALGAIVSFSLYRVSVQKFTSNRHIKSSMLQKLQYAEGWQAFWLIISLRVLPFMPSGAVTFISAISKVKLLTFAIASTLGKIPALFIESFSVYGLLTLSPKINTILACFGISILLILFIKFHQRKT